VVQSTHAPTPHEVGVSVTHALAPPGRHWPAGQTQLPPTRSNPALHLKSQVWVATLQVALALATVVVQVVHVEPQAVVLSATQAPPGAPPPHATVPGAQTHFVPVASGTYPALHDTPQAWLAVHTAEPFAGVGQTEQFGPHAAAVSAAHDVAPPQAFWPAGQVQPPAPSETNPAAALHVNPHAPEVHEAIAPNGTGHVVQLAPQRSGLSALHVVSAPHTFEPAGHTQPPAPFEVNPVSQAKPH
jgi:hypothetical protein